MSKTYVQLGRNGDIMGILPLLFQDFKKTGEKPKLMVAAEFAPILDGVSYVEPVIHEGPHFQLDIAAARARAMPNEVVITQTNAPAIAVKEQAYRSAGQEGARTTSHCKEQWKLAGRLQEWDLLHPLVFDKRSPEREEKLLRNHDLIKRGKQKPLMLLALKGNSSPFPYADLLKELITLKFGSIWNILELPQADRIYDLLALYERASLLIAIDSAPLHLAWACRKLPVFALTQDKPLLWHGSSWKPNHFWYCRYSDWPERAMEMSESISKFPIDAYEGDFISAWNAYESKAACPISKWAMPIFMGSCGRDSSNTLNDSRPNPYLRDAVRMAMQRADGDGVEVMIHRPNVLVYPWKTTAPSFAYRICDGQHEPVTDLFCATKSWWRELLPHIPDFVMSNDHFWSEGLRVLFQQRGAKDETGCCSFVKMK